MPQPDNEKILELIQGAEEYMQNLSKQLIDAHATPSMVGSIVQAWQAISYCYATSDPSPSRAIAGTSGVGGSYLGAAMVSQSGHPAPIGSDLEIEEFLEWKKLKANNELSPVEGDVYDNLKEDRHA